MMKRRSSRDSAGKGILDELKAINLGLAKTVKRVAVIKKTLTKMINHGGRL
jgi:hypothetical protein